MLFITHAVTDIDKFRKSNESCQVNIKHELGVVQSNVASDTLSFMFDMFVRCLGPVRTNSTTQPDGDVPVELLQISPLLQAVLTEHIVFSWRVIAIASTTYKNLYR